METASRETSIGTLSFSWRAALFEPEVVFPYGSALLDLDAVLVYGSEF